jgi:hypothetical protein
MTELQTTPTPKHYHLAARYHTELARFSTWLFGSVVISLTFLLLAGLRNPHVLLLVCMYAAMGAFALTVLVYPLINLWNGRLLALKLQQDGLPAAPKAKDKEAAETLQATTERLQKRLKLLSIAQHIFFIIGLIAVLGFAIEVSLYLFATPTPAAEQGAPAGT